jgi:hypothetical protein
LHGRGVVDDGVDEGEVGSWVGGLGGGQLGAEFGDGAAPAGCGEWVEPDVEFCAGDLEAGGGAERFVEKGSGFVFSSGVVGGEEPSEAGLGVVGGHADGVVEPFAFGVEAGGVGVAVAEGDLGGGGLGGGFESGDLGQSGVEGGAHFGGVGGAAPAAEGGSALFGFGVGESAFGVADETVGVSAGGVGTRRDGSSRVVA